MWLSLVERCVRDAEAAGSNPVIPTIECETVVSSEAAVFFSGVGLHMLILSIYAVFPQL